MAGLVLAATVATIQLRAQTGERTLSRPTQGSERRLALVVGNDSYRDAPLRNAKNDARAIARALEEVGFTVTLLEDATRRSLATAVATFGNGLRPDDVALFYFAGHGVQVESENYLVPTDFQGGSANEIRLDGLRAAEVQQMLRPARVSLIILDACRNNPFSGARGGAGGLAAMEARGSLVAFATGAGQTAADNAGAGNGLFTQELLRVLREPNLSVRDAFYRVRQRVFDASKGSQFPAVYDGLLGDLVFRVDSGSGAAVQPAADDLARREELLLWESIKDSQSRPTLEDYVRRYPNGLFRLAAIERLAKLPGGDTGGATTSARSGWVKIPPGEFVMGCSPGDGECREEESPPHRVRITRGFEIGQYEVTQAEWEAVMQSNPSSTKSPDLPVFQVQWAQLQEFFRRLNARQDGYTYRLPTEAEWEYAARAGSTGPFMGGNLDDIAWHGDNSGTAPHPVGQKQPNAWGLYDTVGNVSEWTQDWYGAYENRSLSDPRGPSSGTLRVIRGGSYGQTITFVGGRQVTINPSVSRRTGVVVNIKEYGQGFRYVRECVPGPSRTCP